MLLYFEPFYQLLLQQYHHYLKNIEGLTVLGMVLIK